MGLTPDEFRKEAKLLIAVKLHEMGRLSTGAAAALAGVPEPLFLTKLADYGVDTFDLTEEELQRDLNGAAITIDTSPPHRFQARTRSRAVKRRSTSSSVL